MYKKGLHMSYHSHARTPQVVEATPATSPKYNLAGTENEINATKNKNGYLSTLFGRSEKGLANPYSVRKKKYISSLFGENRME